MKLLLKNFREELISKIQTANTSINIAIAWFTDQELFDLLCHKAESGVQVRLILGDDRKNFDQFYSLDFNRLTESGGKWTAYLSTDGFMHLKLCLVDDKFIFTGSSNYSKNGFYKNKEFNYLIEEPDVIRQHQQAFSQLWQEAYQVEEGIIVHPEKLVLQFKIEFLYQQISYLEIAIAHCEKQILIYELEYRQRFRDKIEQILKKRTEVLEKNARENPNADNIRSYQESQDFYQNFHSSQQEDQQKLEKSTDASLQQKLKAVFREAVKRCHPDSPLVPEKYREKANLVFDAVKKAMENNDLEALEQLLEDIKSGLAFDKPSFDTKNQEELLQYLLRLEQKHSQLCEQLEALQNDQRFVIVESKQWEEHFQSIEKKLNEELKILNQKLHSN